GIYDALGRRQLLEAGRRHRQPVSAGAQQRKLIAARFVRNGLRLEIGLLVTRRYSRSSDRGAAAVFHYSHDSASSFLPDGGYHEETQNCKKEKRKIDRSFGHGFTPFRTN